MNIFMYFKARGFTLFFAMLVGSLALAVGLAIFDLTLRELDLSAAATQSQYAIYASDTGAECAVYWDTKCSLGVCTANGATNSAFATSSGDSARVPGGSGVMCNGQDISGTSAAPWSIVTSGATTTTTFTMYVSSQSQASATTTCATVTVAKSGDPSQTTVISHGYNTCLVGVLQLERALQVSY